MIRLFEKPQVALALFLAAAAITYFLMTGSHTMNFLHSQTYRQTAADSVTTASDSSQETYVTSSINEVKDSGMVANTVYYGSWKYSCYGGERSATFTDGSDFTTVGVDGCPQDIKGLLKVLRDMMKQAGSRAQGVLDSWISFLGG
jgi:hypothetical protein